MLAGTREEQFEWPMEGHVTRSEQTNLISEKFSFFRSISPSHLFMNMKTVLVKPISDA